MLRLVPTLLRRSKGKRCGSERASIPKGIRNAFAPTVEFQTLQTRPRHYKLHNYDAKSKSG